MWDKAWPHCFLTPGHVIFWHSQKGGWADTHSFASCEASNAQMGGRRRRGTVTVTVQTCFPETCLNSEETEIWSTPHGLPVIKPSFSSNSQELCWNAKTDACQVASQLASLPYPDPSHSFIYYSLLLFTNCQSLPLICLFYTIVVLLLVLLLLFLFSVLFCIIVHCECDVL